MSNEYVAHFVNMLQRNVVGSTGIVLQAQIKNRKGKLDKLANASVEEAYKDWSKKANFDVSGRLCNREFQRLVMSCLATDGEVIIRKHRGFEHSRYMFGVEIIDSTLLDVELNESLRNGNVVRMGVELDKYRRPVRYYFKNVDTRTQHGLSLDGRYTVVDAGEIIHCYENRFTNQTRGIPLIATALMRSGMLDGYEDAAVVAARIGASKLGWWKTPTGDQYLGDDIDEDGAIIDEAEPGVMGQVAGDAELVEWNPRYPNTDHAQFMKICLRGMAAGLNVGYNTLANDYEGVNYTSLRASAIDEREIWKLLQDRLIEDIMQPLYDEWLEIQLGIGTLKVKGSALPAFAADKYKQVRFQGRRWPWVDPQKDIDASIKAIDRNMTTVTRVIRERGDDPEQVWLERKNELERMQELGLSTQQVVDTSAESAMNDDKEDMSDESEQDEPGGQEDA